MIDAIILALVAVCLVVLLVMALGVWGNTVQLHRLLGLLRESLDAGLVEEDEPVEIDPEQMPRLKHYRGGLPDLVCVCHGEPLAPDTDVMMIPVAGSDEIKVYCEREVQKLRRLRGER